MKPFLAFALACSMAVLITSCGGGMTAEEAASRCAEIEKRVTSCFNDEVRERCLSCFEACGQDCSPANACPERFTCEY